MQVQLDHDDPASFEALTKANLGDRVLLNVQQREDTIAEKWNRILAIQADVYMSAADDDPYVVPGYDDKILEASKVFPDGIGTVYGALANLSFTGVSAPTAKMCEKLGYIFPPLFPYWFVDHWVDDIFRMIGRISYAEVRTDQSKAGQTQEMRETEWWATFFNACYLMRRRQAKAILDGNDFVGESWHKELLRSHWPLIEQRSRTLNLMVSQQTKQYEAASGLSLKDERYKRLKNKAIAMLDNIFSDPEMHPSDVIAFKSILMPPTTIPALKQAFA